MATKKRIHFVTGRLAEHFLRDTLSRLEDPSSAEFADHRRRIDDPSMDCKTNCGPRRN